MKKIYSLLASVALMSAITACSSDDEMPSQMANVNGTELTVETVGVAGVNTKSGLTAIAFTNGEKLGLYIYRGSDAGAIDGDTRSYNDVTSGGLKPTENVPYDQTASGWTATHTIILYNVQGTVYAYYPYAASNNDVSPLAIPIKVLTDQGTGQTDGKKDYEISTDQYQYDYMRATPVTRRSNMKHKAKLTMNHELAMISTKFAQTNDNSVI